MKNSFNATVADPTWGTLAAWSWAASRALDYLVTDSDLDSNKVAVIGHSRGGKSALWAAAQDTRLALACVNAAGHGGSKLTRMDPASMASINKNYPHWFTPAYKKYIGKEDSLPFDQHELVALVAPRGYHGGDAVDDVKAYPRASYLGLFEASKAWGLFGKTKTWKADSVEPGKFLTDGALAYHLREGKHDLSPKDWAIYLDHADRYFGSTR
jgi:pimeloyl-ACP methyl ester carboxylesterase